MQAVQHTIEFVHVAANVYRLAGAPVCAVNSCSIFAYGFLKRGNGSFTLTTRNGRTKTFANEKAIERAAIRALREFAFGCPVTVNGETVG